MTSFATASLLGLSSLCFQCSYTLMLDFYLQINNFLFFCFLADVFQNLEINVAWNVVAFFDKVRERVLPFVFLYLASVVLNEQKYWFNLYLKKHIETNNCVLKQ